MFAMFCYMLVPPAFIKDGKVSIPRPSPEQHSSISPSLLVPSAHTHSPRRDYKYL